MRVVTVIAALLAAFLGFTAPVQAAPNSLPGWEAVWATAVHTPNESFAPNWSQTGFADQTVRQVIRVSDGGSLLRVRLSNAYGAQPLEVSGATIARSSDGAGVTPDSVRPLTSGLSGSFRIAAGAELATDPVLLPVSPLESLTITMYFAAPTGPSTYHAQALGTSYLAAGDHRADAAAAAFTDTSTSFYYLSAVETTDLAPHRAGVALFGDSITDGYGATNDARHTYPDAVAERLAAQGQSRPVLNLGIGGNRVTVDSAWMGESALNRFRRDVAGQPGIETVVILEGINDIGLSGGGIPMGAPFPVVSAQQLIDGHRALIAQAHAAGLRAVGATLLPFGDSAYFTPEHEAVRAQVNAWIRTSGAYDAVVDLDTVLADPADPARLTAAYDVGDHLHPSDLGYAVMADAVVAAL
ncbi:SGNH/GDSL hydrolase family protein [Nocardia inohanensis]|uniref:SGNH/GDSL hydrolase family protein n=1 Tax=Nocardia inohanensis TaxID=209246 RepID=UPI000A7AB94D|nr:SGNH/GDSL hydrolase family protein [Nocardia inohanensis]